MANKNIPQIRFKGFDGEWEKKILGEVVTICSMKRVHQSDWTTSGIRFFRARDVVAAFKNEEIEPIFISEEKYREYSSLCGKVSIGDLLVTGVGTIGVPYLIKDSNPIYIKDGNIIWMKNNGSFNGDFLYHCFCGNKVQQFIKETAGTGTVGTYTIANGKKTPIDFTSLPEQNKIASLFTSLDKQISCSEAKLDKLRTIKKTLLKKMFTSQGEKTPQIRFKGFDGEWEEKKLEEIGKVFDGTHFTPKYTEYGIPFYSVESIVSELPPKHISVEDHKKNTQTNKPQKGDILITRIGSLCNVKQMEYEGEYSIYVSLADIQVKTIYNSTFFLYYLQTQEYKEDFLMRSLTTAVPQKINMNELKSTIVRHSPNISEQSKIASLFTSLDKQIRVQEAKTEKLKAVKKTLLKKMFV